MAAILGDLKSLTDLKNLNQFDSFFRRSFGKHLELIVDELKDENRRGGIAIIALWDREGKLDYPKPLVLRLGKVPEHKLERYMTNAFDKFTRMVYFNSHSAAETAKEEDERYYGGVSLELGAYQLYLSFSGLPEDYDELLVMHVLKDLMGNLSKRYVTQIQNKSGNLLLSTLY